MPRIQQVHDRQGGQSASFPEEKGIHYAKPGLDGGSILRVRSHSNSNYSKISTEGWQQSWLFVEPLHLRNSCVIFDFLDLMRVSGQIH
jgi:hypothetical protein